MVMLASGRVAAGWNVVTVDRASSVFGSVLQPIFWGRARTGSVERIGPDPELRLALPAVCNSCCVGFGGRWANIENRAIAHAILRGGGKASAAAWPDTEI